MPSAQPYAMPTPAPTVGERNFLRLKKEFGIYQGNEVGPMVEQLPSCTDHLVEGLIPPRSVDLMVGDSGIGKSPLAYQLGLAVAAGVPFVGMRSRKAKVMYVDYENSLADARWMMDQQRKHLGLAEFPHTFQLWPLHLHPHHDAVEEVIDVFAPDLVILDSLRSFSPRMETDNHSLIEQIRRLRAMAAENGTSFLLIHHLRKRGGGANLENAELMDWLVRAAGVRALVNQSDVRLAVAPVRDGLVLRGHFRTHGEVGPYYLRRVRDEAGVPMGYERGIDDLVLSKLPEEFSFKEARLCYGRQNQATIEWLDALIARGFVERIKRGKYRKVVGGRIGGATGLNAPL